MEKKEEKEKVEEKFLLFCICYRVSEKRGERLPKCRIWLDMPYWNYCSVRFGGVVSMATDGQQ